MEVNAVYQMDALDLLRSLPDGSVDAVVTDPPYNGVKDEAWDNQWATDDDYIAWIGQLCEQWKRVLKPNGSLYVFASPRMAARVEVEIGRWFNVLNRITWRKDAGWHQKAAPDDLRTFFPASEAIIFAEQYESERRFTDWQYERNASIFEPLRCWFAEKLAVNGISRQELSEAIGTSSMASIYLHPHQFRIPTEGRYAQMQKAFPGVFDRPYSDLLVDYERLQRQYSAEIAAAQHLRRPFSVSIFTPYTDVWTFATVGTYPGKHPCEKPSALIEHIIKASTRPGDVVLDCFCGSGATPDAARRLDRRYIANDFDPHWAAYTERRLSHSFTLPMMFTEDAS